MKIPEASNQQSVRSGDFCVFLRHIFPIYFKILNIIVFQNIFDVSYRISLHETVVPNPERLHFSVRLNVPPKDLVHHALFTRLCKY